MAGVVEVLLGPVLGVVGTLGGRIIGLKEKKQDYEHELKKFEHEVAMRAQERIAQQEENEHAMAFNAQETEGSIAKTIVTGSYDGLLASINAEASIKGDRWLENVRGLVRPVLTAAGMVVVTIVCFSNIESDRTAALTAMLSNASLMIVWWFGDRPAGQFKTKWQK